MREIKFRAWDKREKEFAQWEILHYWIHPVTGLPQSGEDMEIYGDAEDLILMQYTGLKDKKGIEIYEGDIVKHLNSTGGFISGNFEVEYKGGRYFPLVTVSRNQCIINSYIPESYEVIGNIHENPELIK